MSSSCWMMMANHWSECFADSDAPFTEPLAPLNYAVKVHR